MNQTKSRILTTAESHSKHFFGTVGDGYAVFAESMLIDNKVCAGPRNFMVKTVDLDEYVEFVIATRDAWRKAKEVEKNTNV